MMKTLFLTGYGLSINVKNTRPVFKQRFDPFLQNKEVVELSASACNFDKVVIQGRGYVSTEALERLAESNINVISLSGEANFAYLKSETSISRSDHYETFCQLNANE